jgi:osmotically-inducible protein OsmY
MTFTQLQNDSQLKTAIMDELAWTASVDADRIGVAITDGTVTLSGDVRSYPEHEAALHAAMRVRGVTAVADEMAVRHTSDMPDDTDIAREATAVFDHLTVLMPRGAVQTSVHDHVITLSGTVNWQYQREAAQQAVTALPGLTGVHNMITLKPTVEVPGPDAKVRITAALVRDAQLDARRIHIDVTGSKIRLTGSVSSLAERRQAEQAAWFTPGVTHVTNELSLAR